MLHDYNKKRNFDKTPEPKGDLESNNGSLNFNSSRFVVQKHDATRLHYDFRLESKREKTLKSWAVPKGISLDPKIKRLAIVTEDHPIGYLAFEGLIPKGNYGAGSVVVWDIGTYRLEEGQEVEDEYKKGKIVFTLYGKKLRGKFSLIKTKTQNQWLLIKSNDEFSSNIDLTTTRPESVIPGKSNDDLVKGVVKGKDEKVLSVQNENKPCNCPTKRINSKEVEFPYQIKPMLATLADRSFNHQDWVFEIKWDGIRSIIYLNRSEDKVTICSRSGNIITHKYPELIKPLKENITCKYFAILDAEIAVLDKDGIPNFQNHQKRMNISNIKDIDALSIQSPSTLYVFDILYLDGKNLQDLTFIERRNILNKIIKTSKRVKISDHIEEQGKDLFENIKKLNLEGIVAKHKFSKYSQGIRSKDWLKIKNIKTQDCIVIGYTKGEGNRENYFGSLLLASYHNNRLKFVGHVGSGFTFDQLQIIRDVLEKLRTQECPVMHIPYTNRDPVWVKPILVAEVKFSEWTAEKIMRTPIFLGFREDKMPKECVLEIPEEKTPRSEITKAKEFEKKSYNSQDKDVASLNYTDLSNLEKIYWKSNDHHQAITKRNLIEYYDIISRHILPYLKNRPLSLSRYPDGIHGKSFYHKNWDSSKPDYVDSIKIYSESRQDVINYLLCNNKESLLWIVNLGCIEIHPWYSRINSQGGKHEDIRNIEDELDYPDFIVFDLDPYIYSGNENKNEEPEYNIEAFKTTVDIAYELKELLDGLKLKSYVKTSGKTGLHIFVPIINSFTFDQTRSFAQIIGKMLHKRNPTKVTLSWKVDERKGKVFFDYNQNAKGKTLSSIFSLRPTLSATVSMPIEWKDLSNVLPTYFDIFNVPGILKNSNDPWKDIFENKQDLRKILL